MLERGNSLVMHDFGVPAIPQNRARFLRLTQVKETTGLSRTTIYRKIARREFPRPVHISERAVGWLETDIEQWVKNLVQLSRDETPL